MPRCISESIRALGTDGARVVRLFDFHTAPGVDRSDGSALQSVNGRVPAPMPVRLPARDRSCARSSADVAHVRFYPEDLSGKESI